MRPAERPLLGALLVLLRCACALVLSLGFHAGIFWLWQYSPLEVPLFALKAGRGGTTGTPGFGSRASGPAGQMNTARFTSAPANALKLSAERPLHDAAQNVEEANPARTAVVKTASAAPVDVARPPALPEIERRETARVSTHLSRAMAAAKSAPPSLAPTHTVSMAFPRRTNRFTSTGGSLLAAAAPVPVSAPGGVPGPVRPEIPGGNGGAGGDGGGGADVEPGLVPTNPRPPYPLEELRAGIEGVVTLRVTVAVDGTVATAAVDTSSGSFRLDEQALSTVKSRWRFTPARRGGRPVEFEVLVPIVFTIVR